MSEQLDENYSGVYDTHLAFGNRPALLVIDFVQAYFDPDCPLFADVQEELESAIRIRDAARGSRVPVIYTNVLYHSQMLNGGRFFEKVKPLQSFAEGSKLGDWPVGLAPADDELVISKQYPSAFFGTTLASTLTSWGVDSVILTGLTTSGCIRASCVDACSHGFTTFVVSDACGDRHESPHTANLFDMQAKYAEVISEQKTLQWLVSLRQPS